MCYRGIIRKINTPPTAERSVVMSPFGLSSPRNYSVPNMKSSFASLSREEIETHIAIGRYGSFQLTDAIRPSYDLRIRPEEGYDRRLWRASSGRASIPLLTSMVSREKLSDLFFDLLGELGSMVDVVLESSHARRSGHSDYTRDEIDLPILMSCLYDFEDLLLNDGYFGIAVIDPGRQVEVRFDEHKSISVFGRDIDAFEEIFRAYRIPRRDRVRLLSEDEHLHASASGFRGQFEMLRARLGIDEGFC